jgi:GH24 family phage-related lysozyme (muramidase)
MPGMADYFEDLLQRRMQKPSGFTPLPQLESEGRHAVGLFDKPEGPPGPEPTLFQNFAQEAGSQVGRYLSAPGGLGLAGANIPRALPQRPQMPPSAPQSVAPNAPGYEMPISSPAFLRGLNPAQRSMVQQRINEGNYTDADIRRLADSFRITDQTQNQFAGWDRPRLQQYLQEQDANLSLAERGALYRELAQGFEGSAPRRYIPPPPMNAPLGAPQTFGRNMTAAEEQALRAEITRRSARQRTPSGLGDLTPGQERALQSLVNQHGLSREVENNLRAQMGQASARNEYLMPEEAFQAMSPAAPAAPLGAPRPPPAPGELGNFMQPNPVAEAPDALSRIAAIRARTAAESSPSLTERLDAITPAKRGQLPSEMPLSEATETPGRFGETNLKVHYINPRDPNDRYYGVSGALNAQEHAPAGSAAIASSGLPAHAKGGGIGAEAYRRWIEHAFKRQREQGITDPVVHSDQTLSPYSNKMYDETLRAEGYDIQRHPQAHQSRNLRASYPHTLDSMYESGIYQVRPKRPLEADAPPASLRDRLMMLAPDETNFAAPLGAPTLRRLRRREPE